MHNYRTFSSLRDTVPPLEMSLREIHDARKASLARVGSVVMFYRAKEDDPDNISRIYCKTVVACISENVSSRTCRLIGTRCPARAPSSRPPKGISGPREIAAAARQQPPRPARIMRANIFVYITKPTCPPPFAPRVDGTRDVTRRVCATRCSAGGAAAEETRLPQRHVRPRYDDMRDIQSGPAADTGESQLLGLSQATRDGKSSYISPIRVCTRGGSKQVAFVKGSKTD